MKSYILTAQMAYDTLDVICFFHREPTKKELYKALGKLSRYHQLDEETKKKITPLLLKGEEVIHTHFYYNLQELESCIT